MLWELLLDRQVEKVDITRPKQLRRAKGKPGAKPTWSSGAKTLVGTAATARSRVWFTVGLGILNEIYFADVEQANTRSVRFLITDGKGFVSDEAWDAEHTVTNEAGIPCCRIETRCRQGRYTIVKEVVVDPVHDAVVVRVEFRPAPGSAGLRLFLMVEPHVGDKGFSNDAWAGEYKGRPVLIGCRKSVAVAVACTGPLTQCSCGYVGRSDALTALKAHKELPDANVAEDGNVAMTAEIDYAAVEGRFTFAIGLGTSPPEAAQEAVAGILANFDKMRDLFVESWRKVQETYRAMPDLSGSALDMYRVSTAVLETHQSTRFPGASIASLSLPWGFARSDKDIGGYHVLWPRDAVETAMGKLASGDARSARSALFFLRVTQEASGGWSQNMFLDGTPHWTAVQMDGTALPILLAEQLRRENALDGYNALPMVKAAARFLVQHGPWTEQDRWEELPGYSPYTMATQVAALLAVADLCERAENADHAQFLRETADAWQDSVDELTYVRGTALALEHGVEGYYVRIAPPQRMERETMGNLHNKMGNLPLSRKRQRTDAVVSPDALALVRFGLRAPGDERILNTIKVLDGTVKRETTTGPAWLRSTKDGYGEKPDGAPYEKTGQGRAWPLLGGERGHYELAAGNYDFALELLKTMTRQTSECGMIPEQIWESADIPERMLFNGRPAGSAMPLVWAHAEYIKLLRSLHDGKLWDLPTQPVERYQVRKKTASFQIWTPKQRRGWLAAGKDLRVDLPGEAILRWSADEHHGVLKTRDSGFGVHCALLPAAEMQRANRVRLEVQPREGGGAKAESFVVRRHQPFL